MPQTIASVSPHRDDATEPRECVRRNEQDDDGVDVRIAEHHRQYSLARCADRRPEHVDRVHDPRLGGQHLAQRALGRVAQRRKLDYGFPAKRV